MASGGYSNAWKIFAMDKLPKVPRTPVINALVRSKHDAVLGIVTDHLADGETPKLLVRWKTTSKPNVVHSHQVSNGFQPGDEVLVASELERKPSLGHGVVVATRELAGQTQVLVDFWETHRRLWLPWQQLRVVLGVHTLFINNITPRENSAEMLRLRNLAYALEQWHNHTGIFSKLSIDPLPHQIYVVHRILTSGNLNWLIADDVGLGKTIEVGMLISALRHRGKRRFLLVVPAGLTRQWQEELRDKFGMREFRIYGVDFDIHDTEHWMMENYVIASLDRLKTENHLSTLRKSGAWDLIVFDEAHRLGRSEYGFKYKTSDRYKLAQQLRRQSQNLLLLTGTPHQGKDDRFRALLELLRPGDYWQQKFNYIRAEPRILQGLIIRNRKADVTDHKGNFIFQGKVSSLIPLELSEQERLFDDALRTYLNEGYNASQRGGQTARAIGFVMTTYRKLASSSIAAITNALTRRQQRLSNSDYEVAVAQHDEIWEDERFVERDEDEGVKHGQFFGGEVPMLANLIRHAEGILGNDAKREYLLNQLIPEIHRQHPNEKLLIFTEYRSTQRYLEEALQKEYGEDSVYLIHGSMDFSERIQAIANFEADGQFLISTEAGGEGINLQRHCHIMVNYDLPWNPMRLVQRVGRLYRYGQGKPVLVFNLNVKDTLDADILSTMYTRLDEIASTMSSVSDYYQPDALKEDILGNLASMLDIKDILQQADPYTPEKTKKDLEKALALAQEAAEKQNNLLQYASNYDSKSLQEELSLDIRHLQSFVRGMCAHLQIRIIEELYNSQVWTLHLPAAIQKASKLKQNIRITFSRDLKDKRQGTIFLNADTRLWKFLLKQAKDFETGGHTACLHLVDGQAVLTAILRWQNDRDVILHQEYVALICHENGHVTVNAKQWADWLLTPATDAAVDIGRGCVYLQAFESVLERRLRDGIREELYPQAPYLISAAWAQGQPQNSRASTELSIDHRTTNKDI